MSKQLKPTVIKLCKSCKEEKEHTEKGRVCKDCTKEYGQSYYNLNKDIINKRNSDYKKNNKETTYALNKKYRDEDRDKYRLLSRAYIFGITPEEIKTMIDKQNNLCAICGLPETRKSSLGNEIKNLSIDHNHETGQIRELLCNHCNALLGFSRENIDILEKTIAYIKKHNSIPAPNDMQIIEL